MEISEVELESYLLYSLKEDIPAQIDMADVQLGNDTVARDTQITFNSNATGNPVFDALVGGTHNFFVKGRFVAQQHRGKFELQDVKVDGIPVPNVLIQALVKKYVKPKYPDVELNEPFDLPWKIEEIKVEPGKATSCLLESERRSRLSGFGGPENVIDVATALPPSNRN